MLHLNWKFRNVFKFLQNVYLLYFYESLHLYYIYSQKILVWLWINKFITQYIHTVTLIDIFKEICILLDNVQRHKFCDVIIIINAIKQNGVHFKEMIFSRLGVGPFPFTYEIPLRVCRPWSYRLVYTHWNTK